MTDRFGDAVVVEHLDFVLLIVVITYIQHVRSSISAHVHAFTLSSSQAVEGIIFPGTTTLSRRVRTTIFFCILVSWVCTDPE